MIANDLALRNAHVITMDPHRPWADALAVRQGRIVSVGTWQEVEAHVAGAPVLDLGGRTVLPGLIDTHAHLFWTALSLAALDVGQAEDHTSLQAIIRQAIVDLPQGELVFGMGFTEYALNTNRHSPIIEALDAVAPDRAVFLMGVAGHASAVNSRALQDLALPGDTPGVMRGAGGRPSGLLADRASALAWEAFSASFGAIEKAPAMIVAAVDRAHSVGITTLHALEGGSASEDLALEGLLAAMPSLSLRLVLYCQTLDVDRVLALGLPRIGGCILLDGDVGPHTAALSQPYADQPDCNGTLYYSQQEIDAFVLRAHRAGLQVAMHAVGDAAVEQALNAYDAALTAHPRDDHRHRIEHCEVIREDQIRRAQRLRVALAVQPSFNHFWPHSTYYATLGRERARRVDPLRTLMRPGLLLAGGSDSTVTPVGPLIGVHAGVNHSIPAERISVQQAIELFTINGARIAFQEGDRGSLEVGKLGDLVALAHSPFSVDREKIKDIPVDMTVVGGDIVYTREC
jgi:predicted amidohydrolase YtcJ